jgi:hypothetical protein
MAKLTRNEFLILAFIVVGFALAVTLTVQSLATKEASGGPSEVERKAAFEEAMRKGNLSLKDAEYWRLTESEGE